MLKYTNTENQSLSVAVWLATDDYDHNRHDGKLHISATGLLKPPRMTILSGRAQANSAVTEEEMDISMNIPSRLGTSVHAGIEMAWEKNHKQAMLDLGYPKAIVEKVKINPTPEMLKADPSIIPVYMEQRASKQILGWIVDGKYDFVGNGLLEDFKSTGTYGYMKNDPYDDFLKIMQGSIYRWLNPDIITQDHMLIQYIFTDWSKLEYRKFGAKGYPATRILSKKFQLKSLVETEAWITSRIMELTALKDTPEAQLPLCTAAELWQSPPVFKYYKNPATTKRSTANFNNYPDAHTRFLKDNSVGRIQEVPGTIRRCGYCNAYDMCTQKDAFLSDGTLQLP